MNKKQDATPVENPVETPVEPKKVITVTLNPSLDRTVTTQYLSPGYHNRTSGTTRLDPAGRGVSISRALHALGVPTHAVILIGADPNGRAYEALLEDEQFPMTILRGVGRTRSNIVIVDTGHKHETVLLEDSDTISREARRMVSNALVELIKPGDSVVFAGSLPGGARPDTYAMLTSLAQGAGAAVAINAGGGEALEQSIQARPMLIYITQSQLERLFNIPVRAYSDVVYCASKLRERRVRRVLIAMEESDQAFLMTETGAWVARWPQVTGTYSGHAEALIAGYLAGRLKERSFYEALHLGAAMAAYTVSQVGHEFGTLRDVESVVGDVEVIPAEEIDKMAQPSSAPQ
jgi:1-phosphofructokinase family hexose kinase